MPRPAVHPRTLSVARWGWRHDFPCTAAGPHIFARVWTQCYLQATAVPAAEAIQQYTRHFSLFPCIHCELENDSAAGLPT